MTEPDIADVIESIRLDAECDIEDFARIYEALITLRDQRDSLRRQIHALQSYEER